MKLPHNPEFTRPITIPQLARKKGVPRRTLFRQLLVWHAADRARGAEHALWLFRQTRGPWSVNLSRLYASHPEFFDAPTPEELQTHLAEVRAYSVQTRKETHGLAAAFREHGAAHRRVDPGWGR